MCIRKIYAQLNRGYVLAVSLWETSFDFDPTDSATRLNTSSALRSLQNKMADKSLAFEQRKIILKFCRKLENYCEYQRKLAVLFCDRTFNIFTGGRIRREFKAECAVQGVQKQRH